MTAWKQALYRNKLDHSLNGKPSPVVEDADGRRVAIFETPELATQAVHAVNAHDALVAALQGIGASGHRLHGYCQWCGRGTHGEECPVSIARAALKPAGEPPSP